ncbi:hypothetical protein E4T39_06269 [Aureobasidium subglaciale]|nr:hypothetical protein E4T39_06269 [Aureobasidium subglaciale]
MAHQGTAFVASATPDNMPLAQQQSILFKLPAEIRLEIYDLVLSTGTIDEMTNTRVIVICDKSQQVGGDIARAYNEPYTLDNFKFSQLSIIGACRLMTNEVKPLLWRQTTLRFATIRCFTKFIYEHGDGWKRYSRTESTYFNVNFLRGIKKVQCLARLAEPKDNRCMWFLDYVGICLTVPMNVTFTDGDRDESLGYGMRQDAEGVWAKHVKQSLEESSQGNQSTSSEKLCLSLSVLSVVKDMGFATTDRYDRYRKIDWKGRSKTSDRGLAYPY